MVKRIKNLYESEGNYEETKLAATVAFLVYVVIVFLIFYNIDKKMLAIFCCMGTALYAALLKRFSDSK